jgi:hypothetical protein
MAAAVFDRRRAERFAQLVDQAEGRSRRHSRTPLDDELADYVSLGRRLSGRELAGHGQPDHDFRTSLRAMLGATAAREGIGVTAGAGERRRSVGPVYRSAAAQSGASGTGNRPVVGSRRTRGAIIIGVAAGAIALSGVSMASGDAMPGDPLYGIKRSTESAQLAMARTDIDRGQTYLGFARNRVREASAVRDDPDRLAAALDDMDNETTHGVRLLTGTALARHDSIALDLIDDFVTGQRPAIAAMAVGPTGAAGDRIQQSLNLIDQIGQRVAALRAGLSCGSGEGGSDLLGPIAPSCPGASQAGQTTPGGTGH